MDIQEAGQTHSVGEDAVSSDEYVLPVAWLLKTRGQIYGDNRWERIVGLVHNNQQERVLILSRLNLGQHNVQSIKYRAEAGLASRISNRPND